MPKLRPARISVLPSDENEARRLFQAAGFSDFKEERGDGLMTFVFTVQDSDVWRVANAIPREMYAKKAIIGGVPPGMV